MFVLTSYCSQLVENRTNTTYVFEKFSYQFSTWVIKYILENIIMVFQYEFCPDRPYLL